MTLPQALAFAIVAAMMALFVWGRLRYDLVAMLALLAAIAVGIVPPEDAFKGFGDDIVIIVASALVLSAAVARSGVTERLIAPLAPHLTTVGRQILVLVGVVTILSAFVKNVGALAIMMPIAFQQARRTGTSVSWLLMPMAFGSLLGGLMTLVGTSPNVIVSRMRADLLGEPFRMFDFTPVGLGIALIGRDLPGIRLPALAVRPQGRLARGGVQHRGLHHRGLAARQLAAGWQDGRRSRGAGRRRRHRHVDHPRAFSPLRPRIALDALSRRRPDPAGRAGGPRTGRGARQAQARDRREGAPRDLAGAERSVWSRR